MAKEVDVKLQSPSSITITFPPGTKVVLRKRVSLDALLAVLQSPESEVEGQEEGVEFLPGGPG